ncbi:MAG: hypothetical protein ACHQFZ_07055 [Acidimicrobiales bacterium]
MLLADLATTCRSAVGRTGYDREIELVPQAEALGRLQSELVQLRRGLTWIGVEPSRIDHLLTKVALDGMFKTRRAIVNHFAEVGDDLRPTSRDVAAYLRLPTPTVNRVLDDLAAHCVVVRAGTGGAYTWRASRWLTEKMTAIGFAAVPWSTWTRRVPLTHATVVPLSGRR